MYAKLKNFTEKYPWSIPVILIIVCLIGIWCYASRTSNIDITGIRNAENGAFFNHPMTYIYHELNKNASMVPLNANSQIKYFFIN